MMRIGRPVGFWAGDEYDTEARYGNRALSLL
jgi:hypothetical protein